jgi:HSP20 family protein
MKTLERWKQTYGSFMRSFTVPEGTASNKIVAEFKDGVLKLRLPKDEKAQSKTVYVKVR